MSKKIKCIAIMAIVIGVMGGICDFLSPSINVDEGKVFKNSTSENAMSGVPIVSARGAILMDMTGDVIFEKDADKKLYPASTTKIMTALVTLEILEEIDAGLDSEIVVPKEAVGLEGSSVYLEEGEVVTVEELLYGAMLQSGNDAATALACCMGPGLESFVERMNKRAKELGCMQTNFVNPTGLFDENHYTTARDLAHISTEAMKNEAFRKIVGSKKWESGISGRTFVNKNKAITQYEGATGVKIGYTKKSGRTLVAAAKREGKELVAVVLNDVNWFNDAYAMLDYGFED